MPPKKTDAKVPSKSGKSGKGGGKNPGGKGNYPTGKGGNQGGGKGGDHKKAETPAVMTAETFKDLLLHTMQELAGREGGAPTTDNSTKLKALLGIEENKKKNSM